MPTDIGGSVWSGLSVAQLLSCSQSIHHTPLPYYITVDGGIGFSAALVVAEESTMSLLWPLYAG